MQIPAPAHPAWNPWCSDRNTLDLYRRRARLEAPEMTCAAQAADILASRATRGETLLDAGCAAGYYVHALQKRDVTVEYHGLDYTPEVITLALEETCPRAKIGRERFTVGAIEYLDEPFDNILCFNVLTNSPHYALPLSRLLTCTRKRLLLRESMADDLVVRYTPDPYLDEDKRHIRVYHNTYPIAEVTRFIEEHGFRVERLKDERSQDGLEMVVDIPHYWRVLVAERI